MVDIRGVDVAAIWGSAPISTPRNHSAQQERCGHGQVRGHDPSGRNRRQETQRQYGKAWPRGSNAIGVAAAPLLMTITVFSHGAARIEEDEDIINPLVCHELFGRFFLSFIKFFFYLPFAFCLKIISIKKCALNYHFCNLPFQPVHTIQSKCSKIFMAVKSCRYWNKYINMLCWL
jgi:hypothetical protein